MISQNEFNRQLQKIVEESPNNLEILKLFLKGKCDESISLRLGIKKYPQNEIRKIINQFIFDFKVPSWYNRPNPRGGLVKLFKAYQEQWVDKDLWFRILRDSLTPSNLLYVRCFLQGYSDVENIEISGHISQDFYKIKAESEQEINEDLRQKSQKKLHKICQPVRDAIKKSIDIFELRNDNNKYINLRDDLTNLFISHQPDWVSDNVKELYSSPQNNHYIDRQDCNPKIDIFFEKGNIIKIGASQKMGKTLFLKQVSKRSQELNYNSLIINLKEANYSTCKSYRDILKFLCKKIKKSLQLHSTPKPSWQVGTDNQIFLNFIEEILKVTNRPLFIGLDNIDFMYERSAVFYENFCSLLRSLGDKIKPDLNWSNLRIALTYNTEIQFVKSIQQSPLENIGSRIDLPELTELEIRELAEKYENSSHLKEFHISQLMNMVGGHPYLVQKIFDHFFHYGFSMENILKEVATANTIFSEFLKRNLGFLQDDIDLADDFLQCIRSNEPQRLHPDSKFKLLKLGLIKTVDDTKVVLRCKLYRDYFRKYLISVKPEKKISCFNRYLWK